MLRTDSELNNMQYGSEDYDTDLEAHGRLSYFNSMSFILSFSPPHILFYIA